MTLQVNSKSSLRINLTTDEDIKNNLFSRKILALFSTLSKVSTSLWNISGNVYLCGLNISQIPQAFLFGECT